MRKTKCLLFLMIVFVLVAGCAEKSWVKNTYDVLSVSGNSYELSRATVIKLYKDGILTDADRDRAIKLSEDFTDAYQTAITAVQAYLDTGTGSTQTVQEKIALYSAASARFFQFITPILERRLK